MKMRWLKQPKTGESDPVLSMATFVVAMCTIKFFFEGVSIDIAGHVFSLGHADAMTYGAMLAPILGVHGANEYKRMSMIDSGTSQGVDNPDAN